MPALRFLPVTGMCLRAAHAPLPKGMASMQLHTDLCFTSTCGTLLTRTHCYFIEEKQQCRTRLNRQVKWRTARAQRF